MGKKGLLIVGFLLSTLLAGCRPVSLPFRSQAPAALSISSAPAAAVYIDDKEQGQTPFYDESLSPGEHTVRLEDGAGWSGKVKLTSGTLTVVNRELAANEASASGEIITLEKGRGLAVISKPNQATVVVDGQEKGTTPLVIKEIAPGDHTVVLKSPGFVQRRVKVRIRDDYQLTINMQLASGAIPPPTALPPMVPTSPPPIAEPSGPHIIVKETGTTFGLHVRSGPGLGHPVIIDIKPGEKYPLLGEERGWVKIRLADGREGWASGRYVIKKG